ncbi:hypothetical protein H0X48_03955 [Candidatus Dependentiae bacterium]|nr:hypothetical protein [Candidatus Dependentiae bacterium]
MKKLTLAVLALITCVTNYTLPYAWTIKNDTDGEISVYVIRKGTRRADDKAKAVKILSKKQAVIDLGGGPAGYCGKGVAAEGLTGSVAKMYVEEVYVYDFVVDPVVIVPFPTSVNYKCGNRTVTVALDRATNQLRVYGMDDKVEIKTKK